MAKVFATYSKAKFEYELIQIRQQNRLYSWKDITEELERETGQTYWEHVYCFPTYHKDVDILIYSSVDRRTGKTRDRGDDAVRVAYRFQNGGKVQYQRVHTHQRINTLFKNLSCTIAKAKQNTNQVIRTETGWQKQAS